MAGPKRFSRVLVLGIDGLDPHRVGRMLRAGQLPALARLRETGRLCELATSNPAESPVAWSSLATGCNPGKHGIFDFIHRDPSGYVPFLSLRRENKKSTLTKGADRFASPLEAPGFWRLTSDVGLPTTVIRWPVTFPAERVNGNFLAGLGVPDVSGRLGKHTFYTTADEVEPDEKVIHVAWRDDRIVTHLPGPPLAGPGGSRSLRAKLILDRTGGGVTVSLGPQRSEIRPCQWSDWFSVRYKWGPIHVCDALVKFYLVGTGPELRLYATPAQIDPTSRGSTLTQPQSYGAELTERIGRFYTLGLPEDTNAVTDGRYDLDAFLQQCAEIGRERRAMFEFELNRFAEGVLAFVFDAGDRVQHMFWSIDDARSPTYDAARARKYAHVVSNLYREMDEVLATALDATDEDTAVFVVSDHGFGPFHRAVNLNRWLVQNGFMKLQKGAQGRSLFADVDWSQTQAYAVGFTSIYLNLAQRESRGVVANQEEADRLVREIVDGLHDARDPDVGVRMIRNAYRGSDIYSGAQATRGPDIVVGFEPGYRASWQTALGAAPEGTVADNDKLWAADHLVDPSAVPGVLATNVPVSTANPTGVDLAPTILTCLGVEVPSYMDGDSWLEPDGSSAHLAGHNGERTDHNRERTDPALAAEPELAGVASPSPGPDGLTDRERAELERHLGDLGYL